MLQSRSKVPQSSLSPSILSSRIDAQCTGGRKTKGRPGTRRKVKKKVQIKCRRRDIVQWGGETFGEHKRKLDQEVNTRCGDLCWSEAW